MSMKTAVTYKKAGVDIAKADRFIDAIIPLARKTRIKGVLGGIGGFSGFFSVDTQRYKHPVMVGSTDGVGTKLLLAKRLGIYDTIGIDLVAMCVNDVVVTGARPAFFLDYYATARLDVATSRQIIKGIVEGCRQAGCALLGGETAELPGLYRKGDFDLAGFCVGIVDKDKIIDGSRVRVGDAVLGVRSSGLHSNGFSLVRKVLSPRELSGRLGREALTPTIIYVRAVQGLLGMSDVKAMAHITGGGFLENIPRVIPRTTDVVIDRSRWEAPGIFGVLQKRSRLSTVEMFRTFNMGIGLVVIVGRDDAPGAKALLKQRFDLNASVIGTVVKGRGKVRLL